MADLGGEAVRKVTREGVGEHEVALAGTDAMVREIARTYPHQELRDSKCCLFVCFALLCFVSFRFV
jgi:creatinase